MRGRKVLTAYAPVAPLGWLVFVELPSEEAYAPLYRVDPALGLLLLLAAWRWRSSPACSWPAGWWCRSRRCARAPRASAAATSSQRISIKTGDELEGARRPVQRHGGQAGGILRRPGAEGRGAHARAERVAGAADRDLGGAAGHLELAGRAGSRYSRRCWRTRRGFARPSSGRLCLCEGGVFARGVRTALPAAYADGAQSDRSSTAASDAARPGYRPRTA